MFQGFNFCFTRRYYWCLVTLSCEDNLLNSRKIFALTKLLWFQEEMEILHILSVNIKYKHHIFIGINTKHRMNLDPKGPSGGEALFVWLINSLCLPIVKYTRERQYLSGTTCGILEYWSIFTRSYTLFLSQRKFQLKVICLPQVHTTFWLPLSLQASAQLTALQGQLQSIQIDQGSTDKWLYIWDFDIFSSRKAYLQLISVPGSCGCGSLAVVASTSSSSGCY